MDAASTQTTLTLLLQALFDHEAWRDDISLTLICRLAPEPRDMDPEAHRTCRFGQWYFAQEAALLRDHSDFGEIAAAHERAHRLASELLRTHQDCLPIPPTAYEDFVAAMHHMRLEAVAVIRDLENRLRNLDPLTGAATRTGMLPKLREQQELVKRKVHSCCVAMMDLDNFKSVNDSHGHAVGDRVLAAFSRHMMTHLRPYDHFFRYGGEEFLICAVAADMVTTHKRLDQLRAELAAIPFQGEDHRTFHVTVSFGLAPLDPALPLEQSIERADKALYAAKAAGRNRVMDWAQAMGRSHDLPGLVN